MIDDAGAPGVVRAPCRASRKAHYNGGDRRRPGAAPPQPAVENVAIARVLAEIGDLLEIRGDNPFKIRAYRNAAQVVRDCAERVAGLSPADLRALPGIGKDIATRITELVESGGSTFHRELTAEFPAGLLDVLRLQGVGPKTTALLYRELGVGSVDDLRQAIATGAVRRVKGMGPGKEAALRKAIEDHEAFAGRYLASDVALQARALMAYLREACPGATFDLVGSLRRGAETCGDLDVLATSAPQEVMDRFVAYPQVERVLGHGPTKSSVRLARGLQADLRLVPADARGAAQQYFTGSKAHNIELRDRALRRGLKLNEYGLFRVEDDTRVAGETEAGIYDALGLAWIAPELREHRGEFDAASEGRLPVLVERTDCLATCTATRWRRTARTPSRPWRWPLERLACRTWPSRTTARRWPWPTDSTSGAHSPTPPRFARSTHASRASRCWPVSNATSARTGRWTWPTTASRNSTSSWHRCTQRSRRSPIG